MSGVECVQCGRRATPSKNTWDELPGWGCLYGILAVCSVECAEDFARESSRHGQLRDGDVEWEGRAAHSDEDGWKGGPARH